MYKFVNLGDFAQQVRTSKFDTQSKRSVSVFASSNIAGDGGYSVPTEFLDQIFMRYYNALLPYCQVIPASSGNISIPTDETTPWASSGIIAEWDDEGGVADQKKPILSLSEHTLRKLRVLIPATEELVSDSRAFDAWIPKAMNRAVTWKINDAIINGIGAARPLGIMNSGARIEVAKVTSQQAGTIQEGNILAMLERSLDPLASVWVINPGCYGQVSNLTSFDSGMGRLAGLPVIATDACSQLGQAGDIILADLSGYRVVSKGAAFANSAHLWFDQDMHAFKLTVRIDGQPILRAPTTPPNSGTTRSHFVSLAERV